EYSKVTHREAHFRRAFAEVFRQRSLMFVGSGLADPYLQGLFTEIQELYGTGSRRHYAFIHEKENVDPLFMRARFNILVIPYEDHDELPAMLNQLDVACGRRSMVNTTAYTISGNENWQTDDDPEPDLMIVRSKLPTHLSRSECAAISVGGGGTSWYVSNVIRDTFIRQPGISNLIGNARPSNVGYDSPDRWYVRRYGESPIFQVRARRATQKDIERSRAWGDRDVRVIREATRSLLNIVDTTPYRTLRMQMLSAGGSRTFPRRVSLIQSVRAFGAWKRETNSDLRLAIHLVAPEVWLDIASGRINVADLATVQEIRFWVELLPAHGAPERRIFDLRGTAPLKQLLSLLAVPEDGWTAEVIPAPEVGLGSFDITSSISASLDDLGVIPGSTLRLAQVT
ncbi:MAG: SIR2 family protein, partial [Actinomycetota bacterium]|nr:SIR2 family protein [Actinomycetota bacterium]